MAEGARATRPANDAATADGVAPSESVRGQRFYKMTGSGNDFVLFDRRSGWDPALEAPEVVRALCARGTGIGADGVVVLGPGAQHTGSGTGATGPDLAIRYFNADGSRASLCGNATLCTAALAARLGIVSREGFTIGTDAGAVPARLVDGVPEFQLPAVRAAEAEHAVLAPDRAAGERRLGFVLVGVPHVVIQTEDVGVVDVVGRGRALRHAEALGPEGANVNFVSHAVSHARDAGAWQIRTYERGVEGETLACGTGAVAAAVLLTLWGEAAGPVRLATRSGRELEVRLAGPVATGPAPDAGVDTVADAGAARGLVPWLRGEGRLVFTGEVGEVGTV